MTALSAHTTPTSGPKAAVRHWHVIESEAGYLPRPSRNFAMTACSRWMPWHT